MGIFRSISKEELNNIIEKHKMWLDNKPGGERADLYKADLSGANLSGANLYKVNLRGANLHRANLYKSDLSGANLYESGLIRANLIGAKLYKADLSEAYLNGADLSEANLSRAYLYKADLLYANLRGADLSGADLREADLREADLEGAKLDWPLACPEKGSFVGYKKCRDNLIVKLEIPEDALRSSATTRKCRCSKAKVLSITNIDGLEVNVVYAVSKHDSGFLYKVGEVVSVDDFDTNRWNECSTGIHFFMAREEAVLY